MPEQGEELITFRTLYESPIVVIRDYDCHHGNGGPGGEEGSEANTIVLMRHGAFCRHYGSRRVTSDVNQTAFFPKGTAYRVSHPAESGDRGTTFAVPPRVLRDMVRELDPGAGDHPDRPFPFFSGPCDSGVFWRHRGLVRALEARDPLEPLEVEVQALQLAADVLEAAYLQHGGPRSGRRAQTRAGHADLTEAAKAHLAARLGERVTLDEVANAVGASPFHLARIFQRRTGAGLHRYHLLLRLRAALERLADEGGDLTELALDLGFSSHSHFTDAFRREFGRPPSEMRPGALSDAMDKTSKNLEA